MPPITAWILYHILASHDGANVQLFAQKADCVAARDSLNKKDAGSHGACFQVSLAVPAKTCAQYKPVDKEGAVQQCTAWNDQSSLVDIQ